MAKSATSTPENQTTVGDGPDLDSQFAVVLHEGSATRHTPDRSTAVALAIELARMGLGVSVYAPHDPSLDPDDE